MITKGTQLLLNTVVESFWNTISTLPSPFEGLVDVRSSSQKTDTYSWFGDPDMPEELVANRNFKSLPEQSYTLEGSFDVTYCRYLCTCINGSNCPC